MKTSNGTNRHRVYFLEFKLFKGTTEIQLIVQKTVKKFYLKLSNFQTSHFQRFSVLQRLYVQIFGCVMFVRANTWRRVPSWTPILGKSIVIKRAFNHCSRFEKSEPPPLLLYTLEVVHQFQLYRSASHLRQPPVSAKITIINVADQLGVSNIENVSNMIMFTQAYELTLTHSI